MAIDPTDTAALLREAQVALHKLRTGTAVVEVDCGDYRTRFTSGTVADLRSYIVELEQRLAGTPARGAVGFVF
ncbi:gpW family head-tail joining protein [Xanthobacter sediminis]